MDHCDDGNDENIKSKRVLLQESANSTAKAKKRAKIAAANETAELIFAQNGKQKCECGSEQLEEKN